mgnify:CR=1 FL=1
MSRLTRLSVPTFPLLVALLSSRGPCEVAQPVVWDFESATLTWRPREDTIALTRTEGVGATEQSRACLRVQGKIAGGWNYAISDTHPLTAEHLYRLSAWVRVDKLGETSPMPFLKCEFVSEDGKGELGRIGTEPYDGSRTGQWQLLAAEFQAPAGTARCWVALEKGGNTPMEIDAYLDDVRIEEIGKLSVFDKYRLNPVPPSLEKVRGVHPRLYLEAKRVAELREAIKTTHAPLWEEVRAQADSAAKRAIVLPRVGLSWAGRGSESSRYSPSPILSRFIPSRMENVMRFGCRPPHCARQSRKGKSTILKS